MGGLRLCYRYTTEGNVHLTCGGTRSTNTRQVRSHGYISLPAASSQIPDEEEVIAPSGGGSRSIEIQRGPTVKELAE